MWRGTSSGLFGDGSSMFLRNTPIKICGVMSQKKAEWSPYDISQHQFHSFCWYEASDSSHSRLAINKHSTCSLFNFTTSLIQVQKSIFIYCTIIFLHRYTSWDCFQDLILRTCQVNNVSKNFLHQCQKRLFFFSLFTFFNFQFFKVQWLCNSCFNSKTSEFYRESNYMFHMAIKLWFSLNSINWLGLVIQIGLHFVSCVAGSDICNVIYINFRVQMINRHYLHQFLVLPASFLTFLTFYLNFRPRHHLPLCEAEVFQIQIQTRWKRHKVLAIRPIQQRRQRVPVSSAIQIPIGLVFGWFSAANTITFPVHCLTHFTILQACIYSHTFSVVNGAGNHY